MENTNHTVDIIPLEITTIPKAQHPVPEQSSGKAFIEANTISSSIHEIKEQHIIPVFAKDNETLISHTDFIETVQEVVYDCYSGEHILKPSIRISHPIKGRIPSAKDKPVQQLEDWEKTLYYERMAFIIEIPSVAADIAGNTLSLTVGGVKAYNLDNLYTKKGSEEHFKVFIGFQNKVCTNLCIWSDGFTGDLKVQSIGQLAGAVRSLIERYNCLYQLSHLKKLEDVAITESQFAQIIGRCRMLPHLPYAMRKDIRPLQLGDAQINTVVKDYYANQSFARSVDGSINLWRLYNLFTGANKSSYIDTFLDRSVNSFDFIHGIREAVEHKQSNWYLS
jgi:hypothetical protein